MNGIPMDNTDNDDEDHTDEMEKIEENLDQITSVRISGDYYGSKSFVYREKVTLTVIDAKFFGSVKFQFYDDATINFELSNCYGSAFFEGYGKLKTKFDACNFFGKKTVIFHGNSTLRCDYNGYYGSVLYEGYAELCTKFHVCNYHGNKEISAKKITEMIEEEEEDEDDDNEEQEESDDREDSKKDSFKLIFKKIKIISFVVVCYFVLFIAMLMVTIMFANRIRNSRTDNMNATESDQIEEFKQQIINVDAIYYDCSYTFPDKVNVTVRGTTYMQSVRFKFMKDSQLTFVGVTCKNAIKIEGYALLHINFHDSSFHGEKNVLFHGDGSMNCNGSTYLDRTTFDHHGKLQQNMTNCVFVNSYYSN